MVSPSWVVRAVETSGVSATMSGRGGGCRRGRRGWFRRRGSLLAQDVPADLLDDPFGLGEAVHRDAVPQRAPGTQAEGLRGVQVGGLLDVMELEAEDPGGDAVVDRHPARVVAHVPLPVDVQ